MDILLVISKFLPEYTGAAHRLNKLYQSLPPDMRVAVLCGGIEHKSASSYRYGDLPVTRLRDRSSGVSARVRHVVGFYLDFLATLRALRQRRFDVLHVAGTSAQTSAALYYARKHDIPTVLELVTKGASPVPYLPVLGRFLRVRLPRRCVIVAISEPLARLCRAHGYADQCWERANPVDEDLFQPAPENKALLRQRLFPFGAHDIVLTMIAKFMPQKNQSFLPDVLAQLPPHFKLALGGPVAADGPLAARDAAYIAALEDRIRALGLEDRVLIQKGFVDNPHEWMQASDIYLVPNKEEGLATPLLEAQACGLYIVANEGEEAFREPLNGSLSAALLPLDAGQWARAIQECLSTDEAALHARSEHIRAIYGLAGTVRAYEKIFRYLMQNSGAPRIQEALHESA